MPVQPPSHLPAAARALESENCLLQEEKGMILKENSNTRGYLEKKIDRYRLSGVTSLAGLAPCLLPAIAMAMHSLFLPTNLLPASCLPLSVPACLPVPASVCSCLLTCCLSPTDWRQT